MTLPSWDSTLVLLLLALAITALTALAAVGRWDRRLDGEDDHESVIDLRAQSAPITAQTLEQVRFTVVARGYRMAEVDALLARMQAQMAAAESAAVAGPAAVRDPEETPESSSVR